MPFDWLKMLRGARSGRRSARRAGAREGLGAVSVLEERTLLSAIAVGGETRANTYTTGSQSSSAIATDADGDYVVTWASFGQDGSGEGIYAQRYNAAGIALGSEFRVNSYTTGNQFSPAISMDADGDFVITWTSFGTDGSGYGSGYGICAQRYNASGAKQGNEFRVNTTTGANQRYPTIGIEAEVDFVIAW